MMKPSKAVKAVALAALISGASTVAFADKPSDGSTQRQRQRQEQRQSAIPGVIDEIPGLSQSGRDQSSSQSSNGSSQSQEQSQEQSQCLICIP
ncbi:MAG: hypothetical protein WAT66_10530 [Actinomycetota bacterium]